MEPELVTLASTAAATVVKTLTTTAWEQARKAIGALWRRAHPDRADTVEAEIADARTLLVAAHQAGEKQTEQDLVTEWQLRLRNLLAADPSLAGELQRLVEQLQSVLPVGHGVAIGSVQMHAEVHDHGRAYQAWGDQHIQHIEER